MNTSNHPLTTIHTTPDAERDGMQTIAHHVWQMKRRPSDIFNVYLIEDVLIDTGTRLGAGSLLKQLANVPSGTTNTS